jgi:hypothetical protein
VRLALAQMPVMNGTKATRTLRGHGFESLIVGMTGDPSGCTERDDFEAAGLNACVDKSRQGVEFLVTLLEELALGTSDSRHGDGDGADTPPGTPPVARAPGVLTPTDQVKAGRRRAETQPISCAKPDEQPGPRR